MAAVAPANAQQVFAVNARQYDLSINTNQFKKDSQGNILTDAQGKRIQKSGVDHFVAFFKETNGAFRLTQLGERICRFATLALKEMGSSMAVTTEQLGAKFTVVWTGMGMARLLDVTQKAKKAVAGWINPPATPPVDMVRDNLEKIHDVVDGAATCAYTGSWLSGSMALKNAGDGLILAADTTDLVTAAQDWSLAKKHVTLVRAQTDNEEVQLRFIEKQRLSFIKLVKAVASVVSGVLGLMVLGLGGPILPAVVLITLSTISTVAAAGSYFYENAGMKYEPIDFFKIRTPVVLVNGPGPN